jgi:hypothetical protein
MRLPRLLALGAVLCFCLCPLVRAGVAPFDLAGPDLEVTVTRGHETLPIAEVPNLAVGDRLWIRADLPSTQSEHYLLIVAFLRGATNPPPRRWFARCEIWKKACGRKGLTLPVPVGAEQVLVFLAPQTDGDFKTLVGAVRGRPGAFVRTSQDLNQATLDISRLNVYLRAIESVDESGSGNLKQVAPKLARSLAIKVKTKCLQRMTQLQAPCLMQGGESLILNDGHSTSIVEALTSGPATALAMEASYTPQLSYGYYSPYIASIIDIARIFSSFTTAQYQYIPALATQRGKVLALTLNTPPSFHDPKSVLVTALPAVEPPQLPPLHAVDPQQSLCIRKTPFVLPVEGAPLVFSTEYAHGMRLRLVGSDGRTVELPATADAPQGGFLIDTRPIGQTDLGSRVHATLHGDWGFVPYEGPTFELQDARTDGWSVATPGEAAVIVGRQDTIHLTAPSVNCVADITVRDAVGTVLATDWKTVQPNEVRVKLPLEGSPPGPLTVIVKQYGSFAAPSVPLEGYSEPAGLDGFTLHAGDTQGVVTGSRLDEVAGLTIDGVTFHPGALSTQQGVDRLTVTAEDPAAAAKLTTGQGGLARVTLKDGRVLTLQSVIAAPRPDVTLIAKGVYLSGSHAPTHIQLAGNNEVPQDAQLTFSVRAKTPAAFDRSESIQVATADGAYSTTLTQTNGGITLETQSVAIATLDPARAFGPSAFGPLQFRVIDNGVAGAWQPLATLVRLPQLRTLVCPATAKLACKLSGADLFLLEAIAEDPAFRHAVQVPDGFPGYALPVPHPRDGRLYVKLRDDPAVINVASVAERQLPPPPTPPATAAARPQAAKTTVETPTGASPGAPRADRAATKAPAAAEARAPGAAADVPALRTARPAAVRSPAADAAGAASQPAASAATPAGGPVSAKPTAAPASAPLPAPPPAAHGN